MGNKKRFTVIDFLIVLVLVAVAAFGAVKVLPGILAKESAEKYEFVVLLAGQHAGMSETISVGERAVINLADKDYATVKAVKSQPAEIMVFDSLSGEYTMDVNEEKEDVYVTLEAEAQVTDTAIRNGATIIKVGSGLNVRGKGYASYGYVISMQEAAE